MLLRRILSGWSMLLRETLCDCSFMTTTAFSVPVYELDHCFFFAGRPLVLDQQSQRSWPF